MHMTVSETSLLRYNKPAFWSAQALSWAGTSLQAVIIPLWLYALTKSTELALVGFVVDAVGRAIFGPVAGWLVGRYSPRRVLLLTDLAGAGITLAMALFVQGPHLVALIYVGTPLLSLTLLANQVAFQSLIPQLIAEEGLARINGNYQAALSAISVLAPATGALLAATTDWRWLVFANCISFVCSYALNSYAVPRAQADGTPATRFVHPLLSFRMNRRATAPAALKWIYLETALFVAFGASQSIFFGFALQAGLTEGGPTLASLLVAEGVGAIIGALVLRKLGDYPRWNMWAVGLLSLCGPALVVTGLSLSLLPVAMIGAALVGASGNLLIGGVTTAIQRNSPQAQLPEALGLRRGLVSLAQLVCFGWTLATGALLGFGITYALAGAVAFSVVAVSAAITRNFPASDRKAES